MRWRGKHLDPDREVDQAYISCDPNRMSGAPTLNGTRLTFEVVASTVRSPLGPRHFFPDLTTADITLVESILEVLDAR